MTGWPASGAGTRRPICHTPLGSLWAFAKKGGQRATWYSWHVPGAFGFAAGVRVRVRARCVGIIGVHKSTINNTTRNKEGYSIVHNMPSPPLVPLLAIMSSSENDGRERCLLLYVIRISVLWAMTRWQMRLEPRRYCNVWWRDAARACGEPRRAFDVLCEDRGRHAFKRK